MSAPTQQQPQDPPLTSPTTQAQQQQQRPGARPSTQAERTRRQAGLFFGGALFVLFSAAITRRAIARRKHPLPSTFTTTTTTPPPATNPNSNATVLSQGAPTSSSAPGYAAAAAESAGAAEPASPDLRKSGPILAVEALTVATLNVFSWAVMLTGGALWALDVGNMEDLRRKVRGGLGVDGTGRGEQEVEEEVEEWIVGVLARKEQKEAARGRVTEGWRNERGRER